MGKKKKETTTTTTAAENDAGSSVFKSIFGNVEDQNAAVSSIFSNNNPFKRKPEESIENHKNDDVSVETEVSELKKRNKIKDKKEKLNLDQQEEEEEATETSPLVRKKKSKKPKTQNPNLGSEENPNLDESQEMRKKKKKRKRDDVEREYEARKYGAEEAEEGKVVGEKRKKADADDAAEMMVPKEGFDDESKLLRTVFVGNLPIKVKKKVLLKEFSKFGEIESLRIRSVPLMDTKVPRKGAILRKQINEHADRYGVVELNI